MAIRVMNVAEQVVFEIEEARYFEWAWETNHSAIPGPLHCHLGDVKDEKIRQINRDAAAWAAEHLEPMTMVKAVEVRILRNLAGLTNRAPHADEASTLDKLDRVYAHKDSLVDQIRDPRLTDWVAVRDTFYFNPQV